MSPQFSTFSQFSSKFSTICGRSAAFCAICAGLGPAWRQTFSKVHFVSKNALVAPAALAAGLGPWAARGGPGCHRIPSNPHRISSNLHRISIESPPFVLYTSNLHRNSYRNSIETPSKPPSKPIETHGWPPASDLGPRIVTARLSPPCA